MRRSPAKSKPDGVHSSADRHAPRREQRPAEFLIVTKLPIFAVGAAEVLAAKFNASITTVGTIKEAVSVCERKSIDLVLFDLTGFGGTGMVDLMPDLQECARRAPVLANGFFREADIAARVMQLGAAGYISKSAPLAEFISAVERVLAGGKYVSPAFGERLAARIGSRPHEHSHELLSPREFDVLSRLANGETLKEIAGALSLSAKTISTYHTHLLKKLHLRTDAELGKYAVQHHLAG